MRIESQSQAEDYILAGKSTVSFKNIKSGKHFTYQVIMAPANEKYPNSNLFWVKVLTGADNQSDYQYLGTITKHGYRPGQRSKIDAEAQSNKVFTWVWNRLHNEKLPEYVEIWHDGTCGRCGRKLTDPVSIETGLGPKCRKKE